MAAVWERFADFYDFSWAPNVVTSTEKLNDIAGNSRGARRLLNGAFDETLRDYDPAAYRLVYSIDQGPSPVSSSEISNYRGYVQLSEADGGGTLVEWGSDWESDSDAGVEFCHGIYVALLGELEASFT
jgi:hypothetical protein